MTDLLVGDVECPECGRPYNTQRAAYLCSSQDTEEDWGEWDDDE